MVPETVQIWPDFRAYKIGEHRETQQHDRRENNIREEKAKIRTRSKKASVLL